jgi:FAD/FMN-containing dehydrogenase
LLEPLKKIGQPILDVVAPIPYTSLQQGFDAGMPKGARYYWKAHYLNELTDEAIDTVIKLSDPLPGPHSMVGLEPMGGAVGRVDSQATAFAHRNAAFAFGIWSGWLDPSDDDKSREWTRKYHKSMQPFASGGAYLNYLDHDDDGVVAATHGDNYSRLQKIKAKYDPDNFFRMNQNIKPAK